MKQSIIGFMPFPINNGEVPGTFEYKSLLLYWNVHGDVSGASHLETVRTLSLKIAPPGK
jgi:hypothetical protein